MFRLVVLACAVALASASSCCTPPQWHGQESFINAQRANGKDGVLTKATYEINFDANTKMVSVVGSSESNGVTKNLKILSDYTNGVEYMVTDGKCTKKRTDDYPGNCIPDTATVAGRGFLGVGSKAINVTQYNFQAGGMNVYMTVTDACVPVAENYYGEVNGTYSFNTISFTGIKAGLKDNTVFNLPVECALGTGTINGEFVVGRRSSFFH